MLNQGITLMIVGMATVFSFLILLVLVMTLSALIIQRFFPEKTSFDKAGKRPGRLKIALAIAAAKAKTEGHLQ